MLQTSTQPYYVFNTHEEAEAAIKTLSRGGFDIKKISLVGKGYHSEEHPVGFYTMGDTIRTWGGIGAFWGGFWGLLFAPAVFFLPGVGLVALAGPLVATLVGVLEGAVVVGGASALVGALMEVGMSKDQAIKYETALKADKFVLMVHGDKADADKVASLIQGSHAWETA